MPVKRELKITIAFPLSENSVFISLSAKITKNLNNAVVPSVTRDQFSIHLVSLFAKFFVSIPKT